MIQKLPQNTRTKPYEYTVEVVAAARTPAIFHTRPRSLSKLSYPSLSKEKRNRKQTTRSAVRPRFLQKGFTRSIAIMMKTQGKEIKRKKPKGACDRAPFVYQLVDSPGVPKHSKKARESATLIRKPTTRFHAPKQTRSTRTRRS